MRQRWIIAPLLLAGVTLVGCAHHHHGRDEEGEEGNEVKVSLEQVPPAVRSTLEREAGGATIKSVDKEDNHGRTVYETDVMSGGQNWEIRVAEDGRLISRKVDNEEQEKSSKKEKEDDDEKTQKRRQD